VPEFTDELDNRVALLLEIVLRSLEREELIVELWFREAFELYPPPITLVGEELVPPTRLELLVVEPFLSDELL